MVVATITGLALNFQGREAERWRPQDPSMAQANSCTMPKVFQNQKSVVSNQDRNGFQEIILQTS